MIFMGSTLATKQINQRKPVKMCPLGKSKGLFEFLRRRTAENSLSRGAIANVEKMGGGMQIYGLSQKR